MTETLNHALRLHEALSVVCPVSSVTVSISNETGLGTAVPTFGPVATDQQKAAALVVVGNFDWSADAHKDWLKKRRRPKGGLLDIVKSMTPEDKAALKDLLK